MIEFIKKYYALILLILLVLSPIIFKVTTLIKLNQRHRFAVSYDFSGRGRGTTVFYFKVKNKIYSSWTYQGWTTKTGLTFISFYPSNPNVNIVVTDREATEEDLKKMPPGGYDTLPLGTLRKKQIK